MCGCLLFLDASLLIDNTVYFVFETWDKYIPDTMGIDRNIFLNFKFLIFYKKQNQQ